MSIIDLKTYSVELLAENYAKSRRKRTRPVSTMAGIRAIRAFSPNLVQTDKELSTIVAAAALRHGHVIDFD